MNDCLSAKLQSLKKMLLNSFDFLNVYNVDRPLLNKVGQI